MECEKNYGTGYVSWSESNTGYWTDILINITPLKTKTEISDKVEN